MRSIALGGFSAGARRPGAALRSITAARPPGRAGSRVINELAWHNLFIRTLLVRPEAGELADFDPEFTDRPAKLNSRSSRTPRQPHRAVVAGELLEEADPDRRRLCRRDEEVGVSALNFFFRRRASCQCTARRTWVRGETLRSFSVFRVPENHAVGRPQPPPHGDDEHGW